MAATRELLVRIGVDQAQSQRAVTAFRAITRESDTSRSALEGLRRASANLSALPQSAQRTQSEFRRLGREASQLQDSVRELREELTRLDRTEARPRIAAPAQTSTSPTGLSQALSSGASLLGGELGGALRAGREVLQLNTALGALGPVALLTTTAIGGLKLLLGELSRESARTTEGLRNLIAGQREYWDLAVRGTREEMERALENKRLELAAARSRFAELDAVVQRGFDDVARAAGVFTGGLLEVGWRLEQIFAGERGAFSDIVRLREQREQELEAVRQLEFDLGRLEAGLRGNVTAANDAAEAERRLAEDRRRAEEELARRIGVLLNDETRYYEYIRTASAQNARDRIAQMEEEARTIRRFLRDSGPAQALSEGERAAYEEARRSLDQLNREIDRMRNEALPLIEARERETAAIERQREAVRRSAEEYANSVARLRDLEASRATLLADRAREDARAAQIGALERRIAAARDREAAQERERRMADIRREGGEREAAIRRKAADDLAEMDREYLERALKAQQDYAREVVRAEEDFGRERLRKLQDLNDDLLDLAAQRDVAGFIRRQRAGLTDLARGDEDFGIRQRRRLEDFQREQAERAAEFQQRRAERQAQLRQELAEQRQQLQQRLEQEREAAQQRLKESQRLEQELSALRARFAEEDKIRTRQLEDEKYRTEIAALRRRQAEIAPILGRAFNPALAAVQNFARTAEAEFRRLIGLFQGVAASRTATPPPARGGGVVRRLATGLDYVPRDNYPALLHRGEAVLTAAQNARRREVAVTYNDQRTITIGDMVSRQEVERILAADRDEMLAGLQMAVFGSY